MLSCKDHGMYTVLVYAKDGIPRIVTSRHVTFDENMFPGLSELGDTMDEHDPFDSEYTESDFSSSSEDDGYDLSSSESELSFAGINSACSNTGDIPENSADVGDDNDDTNSESDPHSASPQVETSQNSFRSDSSSSDDENGPDKYQRFPGLARERKQPSALWGGAFGASEVEITTTDTPTLGEVLKSTLLMGSCVASFTEVKANFLARSGLYRPTNLPTSEKSASRNLITTGRRRRTARSENPNYIRL